MALVSCRNLGIFFGERPLLDGAGLQIEPGERIGLVGRNGEGKSTLLSILAGLSDPEEGEITRAPGLLVGHLPQHVPTGLTGSVEEVVRSGMPAGSRIPPHRIGRLCSLLELDEASEFSSLSGGQRRKALFARAVVGEPDLLLLDEPTNHLDLESIQWMEDFLFRFTGSLLFVTHDRAFLQRLATRILELDRGRLSSWACDYPTFLERRDAVLVQEEREWARFDKKLAKEEEWIRQGIKARRTRNEGRVRALERLRAQRAARRDRPGQVRMSVQEGDRSGARVIEARNLGFDFGGSPIVRGLTAVVHRGDKVGVIGPNGCGKTTLLNLLLGTLQPKVGTVKHGLAMQVAHFDQQREALADTRSVLENVSGGGEFVTVDGNRRHVLAYLQDFLFSRDRAREPVGNLSGGERNRLLLARLFLRPANLLVLDEPTNDLDMETLELLESRLLEFEGTVLVVSHDRSFLDNLCSSTLVFEGGGRVKEYVGGYSDWQRTLQGKGAAAPVEGGRKPKAGTRDRKPRDETGRRGLSYAERREWESLPGKLEELEADLKELHTLMMRPEFYRGDPEAIREARARAVALEEEIDAAFHRWAELDEKA